MKRKFLGLISDGLLVLFALLIFWTCINRYMEKVDAVEEINAVSSSEH